MVNSDWLNCKRPPIKYTTFRLVATAAVKYKVQEIIEEAIFRLSHVFPSCDINDWNPDLLSGGETPAPINLTDEDSIDVIRLARLLGAPMLLPMAFYACCNISDPDCVAEGANYSDGKGPVRLSQEDMRTYLKGREELVEENSRVMKTFLEYINVAELRPASCTTSSRCRLAVQIIALAAMEDKLYYDPSPIDPIDGWLDNAHVAKPSSKPCRHCNKALLKIINARREEAWQKLGKIFGVESWPAGQQVSEPCLRQLLL